MKPLIYATTNKHRKVREEERLRKSIKGSLEAVNITYANSMWYDFDFVHFLSYRDLNKVSDAKDVHLPIVVSALYCENDKRSRMVLVGAKKRVLKNKIKKVLNLADLVLVPGPNAKSLLESQGVHSNIKVFPIPINFKRFEKVNDIENQLFKRFFGEREDTEYVLCVGDYLNNEELNNLLLIASQAPNIRFYFLGANHTQSLINKHNKEAPKNIIFTYFIDDDIFRSALMNAKVLLVLDKNKTEVINVLEAMAAKTQVVVYNNDKEEMNLYGKKDIAIIKDDVYKTANCLIDIFKNKNLSTVNSAYKFALNYNLDKCGKYLVKLYSELLKNYKGGH